jgi:hypothetical protein
MNSELREILMVWTLQGALPLPERRGRASRPDWAHVDERIQRVFESGGQLELSAIRKVFEPREAFVIWSRLE